MIDLLKRVTDKIEFLQIPYMLSGSLAMGFYTIQRTTRDIDLVVELPENRISDLVASFQDDFYCYQPSVEDAIKHKSMFNIIENATGLKVDFIIRKPSEYDIQAFQRRKYINFEGNDELKFWVVAIENLIIAKLRWIQTLQSERQIEDIKSILLNPNIDKVYVSSWISKLNLNTFGIDFKFD
jgi:hypothetical protein